MKHRTIISAITILMALSTCHGFAKGIGKSLKDVSFAAKDTTDTTAPEWYTNPIAGQTRLSRGHGYGKSEALTVALTALANHIYSYSTYDRSQSADEDNESTLVDESQSIVRIGRIGISDSNTVTIKQRSSETRRSLRQKGKLSFSKDDSEAEIKYFRATSDLSHRSGTVTKFVKTISRKSQTVTRFVNCGWSDIEEDLAQNNIYVLAKQTADGCFVALVMKQELVDAFFDDFNEPIHEKQLIEKQILDDLKQKVRDALEEQTDSVSHLGDPQLFQN